MVIATHQELFKFYQAFFHCSSHQFTLFTFHFSRSSPIRDGLSPCEIAAYFVLNIENVKLTRATTSWPRHIHISSFFQPVNSSEKSIVPPHTVNSTLVRSTISKWVKSSGWESKHRNWFLAWKGQASAICIPQTNKIFSYIVLLNKHCERGEHLSTY